MKKENLMYAGIALVVLLAGYLILTNLSVGKKKKKDDATDEPEEVKEDPEGGEDCEEVSEFTEVEIDDLQPIKTGDNDSNVIELRRRMIAKGIEVDPKGGVDCEFKQQVLESLGFDMDGEGVMLVDIK